MHLCSKLCYSILEVFGKHKNLMLNNISRFLGPPMCSGWNWTLKNGRLSCIQLQPSRCSSFVVCICKEDWPISWQDFWVYCEAMVLCCYKAAVGDGVYAWVLTMVPYLWKSEGSGSEGGEREKRGERKRGGREVEVGVEKGLWQYTYISTG